MILIANVLAGVYGAATVSTRGPRRIGLRRYGAAPRSLRCGEPSSTILGSDGDRCNQRKKTIDRNSVRRNDPT
ncbi:hypothetical protein JJB98_04230 [Bradyrhizobium diazoefficiens]|nr:hypothetical protein [Bradyrhizobium diazoefficiens]QQO19169.1 hypothetical protein JJB98_04230 [Bradyrhizobium diazoefficiens]